MEEREGHAGSSPGGTASEASLQPSREGQAHPAAAAATRGQYGINVFIECSHKTNVKVFFNQEGRTKNYFQKIIKKITKVGFYCL